MSVEAKFSEAFGESIDTSKEDTESKSDDGYEGHRLRVRGREGHAC